MECSDKGRTRVRCPCLFRGALLSYAWIHVFCVASQLYSTEPVDGMTDALTGEEVSVTMDDICADGLSLCNLLFYFTSGLYSISVRTYEYFV